MKQLYNEGRVVGLSAYEIYVKQHEADDPDTPPASEREWLSSTIASGSSLIVCWNDVQTDPDDTELRYVDIPLPEKSRLGAANTLTATPFLGSCERLESDPWFAKRILSYGPGVANTSSSSPSGKVTNSQKVPYLAASTADIHDMLEAYVHILDGWCIQPGTWAAATSPQVKTLTPDLDKQPTLRFLVRGKIPHDLNILITGFTNRIVIEGMSSIQGADVTASPEDGDFAGPAVFPWASRIMLTVPSSIYSTLLNVQYSRTIAKDSKVVAEQPFVDICKDSDTYYNSHTSTKFAYQVNDPPDEDSNVLTVFTPDSSKYPPSLYFDELDKDSTNSYLKPVSICAPGTVKVLDNSLKLDPSNTAKTNADIAGAAFVAAYPENYSLVRSKPDKQVYMYDDTNSKYLPVAANWLSGSGSTGYILNVQSGTSLGSTISLRDLNGDLLATSGSKGTTATTGYITWADLLGALSQNYKIDVLPAKLRTWQTALNNCNSNGTYAIKRNSDGSWTLVSNTSGNATVAESNTSTKVLKNGSAVSGLTPKIYKATITAGGNTVTVPSLQNTSGSQLSLTDIDGRYIDGHAGITGDAILTAIGNQAKIKPLTDNLENWSTQLSKVTETDTPYVIYKNSAGQPEIRSYAGQIPNYFVATIEMEPVHPIWPSSTRRSKSLFSTIKLDVFTYQVAAADGSYKGDVNTFANLLCNSDSDSLGVNGRDWYQLVNIPANTEASRQLANLVVRMESSDYAPSNRQCLYFVSPGRPIMSTSTGVPSSYFFTTCALIDLSTAKDTTADTSGIILAKMETGTGTNPWGGSKVNSTNFQGSLSFTQVKYSTAYNGVTNLSITSWYG